MLVIGHRGSSGLYSENTLAAMHHAIAVGAQWIEIDVRLVGGELMVIHDDTLQRTTSGRGSVYKHSVRSLRGLDAGQGETIPNLREVIELVDATVGLNIELKDTQSADAALAAVGSALQDNPQWQGRVMLSSFEAAIHRRLVDGLPHGALFGLLTPSLPGDLMSYAKSLNAFSLNLSLRQLSEDLVQSAHGNGLKVFVYTVNTAQHLDHCRRLGVDAVYTDLPADACAYLARG